MEKKEGGGVIGLTMKFFKTIHPKFRKPGRNGQFYPRVINEADIAFLTDEISLLNTSLKYNLNYKLLLVKAYLRGGGGF